MKPHIRPLTQEERERLLLRDATVYACCSRDLAGHSFGNTPLAAFHAWEEGMAFLGKLQERPARVDEVQE